MTPDEMALRIVQLSNLVYFLCLMLVIVCAAWCLEPWVEKIVARVTTTELSRKNEPHCPLHRCHPSVCTDRHKLDGE